MLDYCAHSLMEYTDAELQAGAEEKGLDLRWMGSCWFLCSWALTPLYISLYRFSGKTIVVASNAFGLSSANPLRKRGVPSRLVYLKVVAFGGFAQNYLWVPFLFEPLFGR